MRIRISQDENGLYQVIVRKTLPKELGTRSKSGVLPGELDSTVAALIAEVRGEPAPMATAKTP